MKLVKIVSFVGGRAWFGCQNVIDVDVEGWEEDFDLVDEAPVSGKHYYATSAGGVTGGGGIGVHVPEAVPAVPQPAQPAAPMPGPAAPVGLGMEVGKPDPRDPNLYIRFANTPKALVKRIATQGYIIEYATDVQKEAGIAYANANPRKHAYTGEFRPFGPV